MILDYKKRQDESEIRCVERFLPFFNKINNSNYINPTKNANQNEIDVFCFDGLNKLKIQVKKIDFEIARYMGISHKLPWEEKIYSSGLTYREDVLSNIKLIEDKYLKQKKDMSAIILLLDELKNPPDCAMEDIKKQITKSIFKEIWIIRMNKGAYRIF